LKFLKTRDLRQKTAEVLQNIKDEEYVITSNGKPVALLSAVDDDDLELQLQADRLTEDEIAAEVKAARRDR